MVTICSVNFILVVNWNDILDQSQNGYK